MSTSSTILPTLVSSETVTWTLCAFGTAAVPAVTETITITSLDWTTTSRATELRYVPEVIVRTMDTFTDNCTRYFACHAIVYPNPEISGRGVLTAFVVSAYLVLALIIWAYWYGALPEGLVRRVDRRLFFARKQQLNDKWRRMLVELVLNFSDQQLLTGLAILVAGYVQALGANLSIYHWNTVIYLAWLSSTVHLMSLSVLRDRLGTNKTLRFIRLFVMISILGLLLAALVPTITNGWPSSTALFGQDVGPGLPVRCLWNIRIYGVDKYGDYWVSYVSLLGAFVWKVCQFFDCSREWVRFWSRAQVECFLEETAKRILQEQPRWHTKAIYKTVVSTYVAFVALMELLESFMLTMLLLAFTLAWGTYQLFHSKNQVKEEIRSAEREMGFGQLLPILLLSQPMFVAVQIYLEQETRPISRVSAIGPARNSSVSSHGASITLAEALQSHGALLPASAKATGLCPDGVINHLYQSRVFLSYMLWIYCTATVPMIMAFTLPDYRTLSLAISVPLFIINPFISFPLFFFPWSKRLM